MAFALDASRETPLAGKLPLLSGASPPRDDTENSSRAMIFASSSVLSLPRKSRPARVLGSCRPLHARSASAEPKFVILQELIGEQHTARAATDDDRMPCRETAHETAPRFCNESTQRRSPRYQS
jgi:hypothetical protein